MKPGRSFLVPSQVLVCTGACGLLVSLPGCDGRSEQPVAQPPQPTATQFPPPKQGDNAPVDPSELFKDKEKRVYFAPKHPELAFTEHSQGLPTSGTWLGYPLLHDFNGDGRADLVASNREEDGYSAWLSAKGPWVRCIEGPKKDVELFVLNDGRRTEGRLVRETSDVYVVDAGAGEVELRKTEVKTREAGGLPRDMQYGPARAADIDGDRRPDLLVSAHTDALRVYLNVQGQDDQGKPVDDGKLHWLRSESPIENPFLMLDIAVGDLDGDAHPDVVGIGHFKGGLGIYLGDGRGALRRLPESAKLLDARNFGRRIELADVDGDGLDDIVTTTNVGLKAFITRKGPPLEWEERSTGLPNPPIGNSISGLCVAHFREGRPVEIAVCNVPDPTQKAEGRDTFGLYGWSAEAKTWEHVDSGIPRNEVYREVNCADFNADGKPDLLLFSLENGGVVYLGDGHGGFVPKGRLPGIFGIGRTAVGDIDGDGLVDVAVAIPATKEHPESGGVRAFLNRADLWK